MALKINANKIELVPLKDIKLNPKNRNKHSPEQIAQFVKILRYQGNRNPGVISNRSGLLVAGEGRYLAMKEAGETHMPVMFQDFEDEEQEYLYGISDNAIASQAALDLAEIHVDLKDMGPFDLDLLGIRDFQFEPDPETQGDPDAVPEVPKVAKTKRGELWTLGNHRLLIDDCTVKENVERLMAWEKADMVFTDPPYGISLIKKPKGKVGGGTKQYPTKEFIQIAGDNEPFDPACLFGYAEQMVVWGGNYFADKLPPSKCWFVWDKKHPVDRTFCGCELAWTNLDLHAKVFECTWDGWTKQGESGSKVHPSQKPIKLCADIIEHVTASQSKVLDLFLGSGSTLIACEQAGRRCFGTELEPLYGDVILARYAKFTGKDPVREDGVKWSELNG